MPRALEDSPFPKNAVLLPAGDFHWFPSDLCKVFYCFAFAFIFHSPVFHSLVSVCMLFLCCRGLACSWSCVLLFHWQKLLYDPILDIIWYHWIQINHLLSLHCIKNIAFLFCDVFALSQFRSFDKDRDHHREKCNISLVSWALAFQ